MSRRDPHAPSPDDLLARFRESGDPEALGALFDATGPALFSLALTLGPDAAAAEDAVQETFLAAMEAVRRHDPARPALPWLVGILHHKVSRIRRRKGRAPDPRRMPPPAVPDDPVALAGDREEAARVRAALDGLPEPYRRVALLRWRHGLSPAEIAALDRTAPGTVRSILHRARERLRRRIAALPVFLWPFGGERGTRGLDAVRHELMAAARRRLPPVAAAAGAAAGGILMAKKVTMIAAAVLLLAVGWAVIDRGGGTPPPPADTGSMAPLRLAGVTAGGTTTEAAATTPAEPDPGAATASGFVVDPAGQPVPGARVVALPDTIPEMLTPEEAAREDGPGTTAVADAAGRFRIALSDSSPLTTLLARADGYAPGFASRIYRGQAGVRIRLGGTEALYGTVRDQQENPVPGAKVRVSGALDCFRFDREAVSDADGRYRVGELPAGRSLPELLVEVRAEGFPPFRVVSWKAGPLDPYLAKGMTVRGTVVDGERELPIEGARVVLYSIESTASTKVPGATRYRALLPWRIIAETTSEADGSFRFEGLPAKGPRESGQTLFCNVVGGGQRLFGYVGARMDGRAPATEQVLLQEDGGTAEATLSLWPAAAVTGRIVDTAGEPVADANVRSESVLVEGRPGQIPGFPPGTMRTDEAGRFRFEGIPAKAEGPTGFTLFVSRGISGYRHEPEETGVDVFAGRTTELPDIVLAEPPWPEARFRILRPDGRPAWGATVDGRGRADRTDAEGRARWRYPLHQTVREGEELPEVPFEVHARGFARTTVTVRPSRTDPPEVEVRLEPGHVLAGVVTERDGSAPAHARVAVADGTVSVDEAFEVENRKLPHVITWSKCEADGSFLVEDLPAGTFHVRASEVSDGPIRAAVPADTRDLALSLPFLGTVEGSVVDGASGEPVPDFAVVLGAGPISGFHESRPREAPHRFRIVRVPIGSYRLLVYPKGAAPQEIPVVVESGKNPPPIEVRLFRGTKVRGRLRAPSGTSLAGYRIGFAGVGPSSVGGGAAVGADGTYEVGDLPPGRYRVTVYPGKRDDPVLAPVGPASVEVPPDRRELTFDAELVPAGRLSLGATDGAARIEVRTAARALLLTIAPVAPRGFQVEVVPPGDYTVTCTAADGTVREERATVRAGETTKVRF